MLTNAREDKPEEKNPAKPCLTNGEGILFFVVVLIQPFLILWAMRYGWGYEYVFSYLIFCTFFIYAHYHAAMNGFREYAGHDRVFGTLLGYSYFISVSFSLPLIISFIFALNPSAELLADILLNNKALIDGIMESRLWPVPQPIPYLEESKVRLIVYCFRLAVYVSIFITVLSIPLWPAMARAWAESYQRKTGKQVIKAATFSLLVVVAMTWIMYFSPVSPSYGFRSFVSYQYNQIIYNLNPRVLYHSLIAFSISGCVYPVAITAFFGASLRFKR